MCDSIEEPLGLRFYHVDPDKGFFLNGEPYRIHGVCRHQDVWNKGWALSDADHARDVQLIMEIGANAVRCSHYQQSDEFYSLCDKSGLLVWAELPLVTDIIRILLSQKPRAINCSTWSGRISIIRRFLHGAFTMKSNQPPVTRIVCCGI